MNEQAFEEYLRELFKCDFSAGTEEFREALLRRCLEVLDRDGANWSDEEDLDDAQLDLISAAGYPDLPVVPEN